MRNKKSSSLVLNEKSVDAREIAGAIATDVSVLLGAGASVPLGLPGMADFIKKSYEGLSLSATDKFPKYHYGTDSSTQTNINKSNIIKMLLMTAGLRKNPASPAYDLEDVFEFIHKSYLRPRDKDESIAISALFFMHEACKNGNGTTFADFNSNFHAFKVNYDKWKNEIITEVDELRRNMIKAYIIDSALDGHDAKIETAIDMYDVLIGTVTQDTRANIFTTNYDTVFEALSETQDFDYEIRFGFNGKTHDLNSYIKSPNSNRPIINLFKLHGSVNWEYTTKGVRNVYPKRADTNENTQILEPVLSKSAKNAAQPFKAMYEIFENALTKNKALIAIGFSFRDTDLRELIKRRLKNDDKFKLLIIAPGNRDDEGNTFLKELTDEFGQQVNWAVAKFGTDDAMSHIGGFIRNLRSGT